MDNKQCQNENDMSLHYTSRGKFDASQCEPRISSDEENTIRSAIVLQKGEAEAEVIFANSPERLHDYTILKGVNSYAALGRYYLVHETSVPEEMYEYMDLDALGCRYEDEHPGVFDLDFDKREFSAVHIMDGWSTWAMRDVIPSIYQATSPRFATAEEQLHKLLELLDGMELTSPGHLTAQNFSFSDEIMMEEDDGKLNFYIETNFDVDAAFGTFVCTDENDDWLNIYANYDIAQDRPCDTLELNLCKGDGTEENWSYHLNAAEQEVLSRKMEEFCQQQNGMSLHVFARQLQEVPGPSPQIQM